MVTVSKSFRTASGSSITATLQKFGNKAFVSLGKQLYREATGIVEQSAQLVPVDTGTLRASRYVSPPVQLGTVLTVAFGYGGPAAKINPKTGESADGYAIYVHEDLEAFHKVGIAKFLELPTLQALRGMTARVKAGMKADLAGAGDGSSAPGEPDE